MNHPGIQRILDSPHIEQRTPEWFAYRCSRVTASEVSVILAQDKGAKTLMSNKTNRKRFLFLNYVHKDWYWERTDLKVEKYRKMFPDVAVYRNLSIVPHKAIAHLAASLHACTNTGINVEIKTCFKDKFVGVCKAYRDQVQLQMEVADLETTHLVVQEYFNMVGRPIVIHNIQIDREEFKTSAPIIEKCIEDMQAYTPFDMSLARLQMNSFSVYSKCVSKWCPSW